MNRPGLLGVAGGGAPGCRVLLALFTLLSVTACNDGELAKAPVQPEPTPEPGMGHIEGRVCGPQGDVWLASANVFVIRPDDSKNETTTDLDGYFTLTDVHAGTQTLYIEKGSFSTSVEVEVEDGQTTELPEPACVDAGSAHVAVVTGDWDNIEAILAGAGITDVTLYDGLNGTSPSDRDLLGNLDLMAEYDIIFLNCGQYESFFFTDPAYINNLRAYVDAGGSLYASDWAYDFVEVAFPESIDFDGDDNVRNAAATGDSGPLTGTVEDPALATALGDSSVSLNYDLPQWVVPASSAANARVLVRGTAPATDYSNPFSPQSYTVSNAPLAIQFSFGSSGGSVIYTSFHNESQSTQDMDLILAYMVFEL